MVVEFKELYGGEAQSQRQRYEELQKGFEENFGSAEGAAYFSAPGRTEIGENHTEHNH